MATDEAIANALAGRYGPVVMTWRFEQRTPANELVRDITDYVIAAEVAYQAEREAVWSASITLRDGYQDVPNLSLGDPDVCIAVWTDLRVGSETVSYQRGLYATPIPVESYEFTDQRSPLVFPPTITHRTATLAMADVSSLLGQVILDAAAVIDTGDDIVTFVRGYLDGVGLANSITGAGYVAPFPRSWAIGTPVGRLVADCLNAMGYWPLWADCQGTLRSAPKAIPTGAITDPSAFYATDVEPRMLTGTWEVRRRTQGLPNEFRLFSSTAGATAVDDAGSPISVVLAGALPKTGQEEWLPNAFAAATRVQWDTFRSTAETVRASGFLLPDLRRGQQTTGPFEEITLAPGILVLTSNHILLSWAHKMGDTRMPVTTAIAYNNLTINVSVVT